MNSDRYVDMLGESLLPEVPLITSGDYIFQQDNASIHVSKSAKLWLEANSVNLLDWPARRYVVQSLVLSILRHSF